MLPFDRLQMTAYWRSSATMALSGVVSEIQCNIGADSQIFSHHSLIWRFVAENCVKISKWSLVWKT